MMERRLEKQGVVNNKRPLWQCGPCGDISSEYGRVNWESKSRVKWNIEGEVKCKKKCTFEDSDAGAPTTPNRKDILTDRGVLKSLRM